MILDDDNIRRRPEDAAQHDFYAFFLVYEIIMVIKKPKPKKKSTNLAWGFRAIIILKYNIL